MPTPNETQAQPNTVSPQVNAHHPQYDEILPTWEMIGDCLAGEQAIKAKGDIYLPRPNPADVSPQNQARYGAYKTRAKFYNVTRRTRQGLVGQVISGEPEIQLPDLLSILESDVDGGGNTIRQQSQQALASVVAFGRCGLLSDYPTTNGATTVAQQKAGAVRPTITFYPPQDIINWRTISVGGENRLSLVVLAEKYVKKDDGFKEEEGKQWRVLRLDENRLLVVEIYIEADGGFTLREDAATQSGLAQYFPTNSRRQRLDFIPFSFVGSEDNDCTPDDPPLYDLASLNLGHYCNSADYEEAVYITGQPMAYFAGLNDEWVKNVMKGGVQFGSQSAALLPVGGSAGLLQANPNTLPKEAMEAKERQMVALGAKLVEQRTVQRTATETALENASEASFLATMADNVSDAYADALVYCLNFASAVSDFDPEKNGIVFRLDTNFDSTSISPTEALALAQLWQQGAITGEELRQKLRRSGLAYLSNEDWVEKSQEEIMSKIPIGSFSNQPPENEDNQNAPKGGEQTPPANPPPN